MMRQAGPARRHGPGIEWDAHPAFRQVSLAAWFSTFVDLHDDPDLTMHEACRVAAAGVRARFAALLQFRADQQAFVLRAGTGWQGPEAGCVRQAADLTTTAGLAWHTGQLIHFRGLHPGRRVRALDAMTARGVHHVLSIPVLSVPASGEAGEGFGVIEVGSADAREFTWHDASFLQALAQDLAAALGRRAIALPPP